MIAKSAVETTFLLKVQEAQCASNVQLVTIPQEGMKILERTVKDVRVDHSALVMAQLSNVQWVGTKVPLGKVNVSSAASTIVTVIFWALLNVRPALMDIILK